MKIFLMNLSALWILFVLSGCQTASSMNRTDDSQEALTAVGGALIGKQLSEQEVRALEKKIRTDPEAQTAIQAIRGSVSGKGPSVKYCPLDGKRYAAHLTVCPEHGVDLQNVDSGDE